MGWPILDAVAAAHGLTVGSPTLGQTNGGKHANGSHHYTGNARDYGRTSDAAGISRLFAPVAKAHPDIIPELFGIDGVGFDSGKPYQAGGHTGDHTHVAIGYGVTVERLEAAIRGAPGAPASTEGAANVNSSGPSKVKGISEGGLKRFLLITGGAGLTLWGLALVGLDLGAVRAIAKRTPVGKVASLVV